MVQKRTYVCDRCGREVRIRSKGLCPACRAKELNENKERKPFLHKTVTSKKKTKDPELSGFFRLMLDELNEKRMSETGRSIPMPTVCNVCHILPKRIYKSVAKERRNIIFLTDTEHTRFDYLLDTMDFDGLEREFGHVWAKTCRTILDMERQGMINERGRLIIEFLDRYGCVSEKNVYER